jgi:hypothetical protein
VGVALLGGRDQLPLALGVQRRAPPELAQVERGVASRGALGPIERRDQRPVTLRALIVGQRG